VEININRVIKLIYAADNLMSFKSPMSMKSNLDILDNATYDTYRIFIYNYEFVIHPIMENLYDNKKRRENMLDDTPILEFEDEAMGFDPETQVSNIDTNVDIVFCIDGTGSMAPVIEEVKRNALSFHDKLQEQLKKKHRPVKQTRIKVIVFRDVYCDENAFSESKFFVLPDESTDFANFVNSIVATGGGDEPESGLEALAKAISSEWVTEGKRKRHIIVVFTDASCHPLEKPERHICRNYPVDIPRDLAELEALWSDEQEGSRNARRLAIYAPNSYPWNEIGGGWDLTTHVPSRAGEGCEETKMDVVISFIRDSI
jgi:hypothetical protein